MRPFRFRPVRARKRQVDGWPRSPRPSGSCAAVAGLVLSIPLLQFISLFPVFGCYLAIWLALNPHLPVIQAARFGDLSYGLYIYGWPVEEAVMWLSGGHAAWWHVFLCALPGAAILAFLSWHLVEHPMMRPSIYRAASGGDRRADGCLGGPRLQPREHLQQRGHGLRRIG